MPTALDISREEAGPSLRGISDDKTSSRSSREECAFLRDQIIQARRLIDVCRRKWHDIFQGENLTLQPQDLCSSSNAILFVESGHLLKSLRCIELMLLFFSPRRKA